MSQDGPVTPDELEVYQRWEAALGEEVAFWDGVIRTGGDWPDEIRERLDPGSPLQAELRALLIDAAPLVRILDVGAGPFTTIGKRWDGRQVHITAIDPLAEHYTALRERYGVVAPVPTITGDGEGLVLQFGDTRFDLAYARNSLDHSRDPFAAIQQMLAVVTPGGWVVLDHSVREADKQNHAGLHQHNFFASPCPTGTDVLEFFIESGGRTVNVSHELAGLDQPPRVREQNGWVHVEIKKRRTSL